MCSNALDVHLLYPHIGSVCPGRKRIAARDPQKFGLATRNPGSSPAIFLPRGFVVLPVHDTSPLTARRQQGGPPRPLFRRGKLRAVTRSIKPQHQIERETDLLLSMAVIAVCIWSGPLEIHGSDPHHLRQCLRHLSALMHALWGRYAAMRGDG